MLAASLWAATPVQADPVVLSAAGCQVRLSELETAVREIPDPPEREGMAFHPLRAARWYVRLVALSAAAERMGLNTPQLRREPLLPRRQGLIARLMRHLANHIHPAPAQQHAYYRQHPAAFTQIRARYILISDRTALNPRSPRSAAAARILVASLGRALRSQVPFATLARKYSDDSVTRVQGGELGFVKPAQLTPRFARVLLSLPPGQNSAPFLTRFGWNLVQAGPRRRQPFAAVQARIVRRLRQQLLSRRLAALLAAADLVIHRSALLHRPLGGAP